MRRLRLTLRRFSDSDVCLFFSTEVPVSETEDDGETDVVDAEPVDAEVVDAEVADDGEAAAGLAACSFSCGTQTDLPKF